MKLNFGGHQIYHINIYFTVDLLKFPLNFWEGFKSDSVSNFILDQSMIYIILPQSQTLELFKKWREMSLLKCIFETIQF